MLAHLNELTREIAQISNKEREREREREKGKKIDACKISRSQVKPCVENNADDNALVELVGMILCNAVILNAIIEML